MDCPSFAFFSVCALLLAPWASTAPTVDVDTSDVEQKKNQTFMETTKGSFVEKRPKYMDTRELQDAFKDIVYLTLQQLVSESKVSPDILLSGDDDDDDGSAPGKRAHQALCLRRTPGHQRFVVYPCWHPERK